MEKMEDRLGLRVIVTLAWVTASVVMVMTLLMLTALAKYVCSVYGP
jgi:hypothetical protein